MPPISLRPAIQADLPAISAIYNHYVVHSTCTYQTEPESLEQRQVWFNIHGPAHPVIVAEDNGRLIGWGSISRFHARSAYGATVEDSVYVDHNHIGRGIGKMILQDLIDRTASLNHHTIVALISADQIPSIGLHEKFGFVVVGRLKEVGRKFDTWLDVIYMQKILS